MEEQNQETILPLETPQHLVPSAQENHHPNLFLTENNGSQLNPPLNLPCRSRPLNFPSRLIDSFDSLNLTNHHSSVFGGQALPGSSSNPVLSPFSPINFPRSEMGFNPNPNQSDLDLLEEINGGFQYPHCLEQAEAEEIIREEEINGEFQYSYDLVLAEAERIQRNLQRLRTEFRLRSWNSNLAPDLDSNTNSRPRRSRRSRNQFNATASSQPMFLNSEPNNSNYLDSSNLNLLNSAPNLIAGLKAALSPLSLEQFKGKLNFLARNQTGSKFLQAKLESGKQEDVDLIFTELKFFVQELLTDQVGNHVMQKLFAACNEKQMNFILFELFNAPGGLLNICRNSHGSRCVQKFIEHLTSPSLKATLVKFLKPITCSLIKTTNGRCVIEFCLRIFSHEDVKPLLSEIVDNFSDIAADRWGCCVVQRCVDVSQGEIKSHLFNQIATNALFLSEDPYGNYVVQYIIDGKRPHACAALIQNLKGYFVSLSMNKYGSNVVEKCLQESSKDQSKGIIIEIMTNRDFLTVLQDPFGNFVAQTALLRSQDMGQLHDTLVELILRHYPFLNSHPHGKRVLARARDFRNNNRAFRR